MTSQQTVANPQTEQLHAYVSLDVKLAVKQKGIQLGLSASDIVRLALASYLKEAEVAKK